MPHEFIRSDSKNLEGVWLKPNGRRFCAWRFDLESGTLKTSRGVAVVSTIVESASRTLDELKEQLPRIALDLARGRSENGAVGV